MQARTLEAKRGYLSAIEAGAQPHGSPMLQENSGLSYTSNIALNQRMSAACTRNEFVFRRDISGITVDT